MVYRMFPNLCFNGMKGNLMNNEYSWVSAHLYYANPINEFLRQFINTVIKKYRKKHLVEKYFFIRYNEKGPHIRLRFLVESKYVLYVKEDLKKSFDDYVRINPAENIVDGHLIYSGPIIENEILFVDYEPEFDRYGQQQGILIAEDHFQFCSSIILQLIKKEKKFSYEKSLGYAIRFHLGILYAIGIRSCDEIQIFLNQVFVSWLTNYYRVDLSTKKDLIFKQYKDALEEQKNNLFEIIQHTWDNLLAENPFIESWFSKWISENVIIYNRYSKLRDSGYELTVNGVNKEQEIGYIYNSLMHMTNNRLGIQNKDESYLMFILLSWNSANLKKAK